MTAPYELDDDDKIAEFLRNASRVAVIGMKPEGPAQEVPEYLREKDYETVPVNPYYIDVDDIECVDRVNLIEEEVDIVNIFRRSEAIHDHVHEIVMMDPQPKLVWFQLGIRNNDAAQELADEGIPVVQDRCIKVEHGRLLED
jgi:predicted CoA-binding protein